MIEQNPPLFYIDEIAKQVRGTLSWRGRDRNSQYLMSTLCGYSDTNQVVRYMQSLMEQLMV